MTEWADLNDLGVKSYVFDCTETEFATQRSLRDFALAYITPYIKMLIQLTPIISWYVVNAVSSYLHNTPFLKWVLTHIILVSIFAFTKLTAWS